MAGCPPESETKKEEKTMDLYGLKEDSMEVAKIGASALAGAAIAKVVVEQVGPMLPEGAVRKFVAPVLPIAVGLGVHSYGKAQFPVAAPGIAAGMVAVGLGNLIGALAPASTKSDDAGAMIKKYIPFAGLGQDTYDTGLMGLGYSYGAGVDAYMNGLGYGGYSYAPGAPVAIQTLSGAPTQVQSLMGAPTQVQSLMGLGSSIVGSSAPLSASLM